MAPGSQPLGDPTVFRWPSDEENRNNYVRPCYITTAYYSEELPKAEPEPVNKDKCKGFRKFIKAEPWRRN